MATSRHIGSILVFAFALVGTDPVFATTAPTKVKKTSKKIKQSKAPSSLKTKAKLDYRVIVEPNGVEVPEIRWEPVQVVTKVPSKEEKQLDPTGPQFLLKGTWSAPKKSLLINGQVVTLTPEKDNQNVSRFEIKILETDKEKPVLVYVVDESGEAKQSRYFLKQVTSSQSRWNFIFSLGPTLILYEETYFGEFTQFQMTGKAAVQFWLIPGGLDLLLNGFFTAVPITNSFSSLKAWFVGANFRVGYTIPLPKSPVGLRVALGAYNTNFFCTGVACGYSLVFGIPLTIEPSLQLRGGADRLTLPFRLGGLFDEEGSYTFRSREIGIGLAYSRGIKEGRQSWSIGLDLAQLVMRFSQPRDVDIRSTSISLGFGYRF